MMKHLVLRLSLITALLCLAGTHSSAQFQAEFTSDITSACSPALVNFTNSSTGNPTSFAWDFGDGGTSTLEDPSHSYSVPGVYTVSLTISNGAQSDTETKTAYITVFRNPVASFTISEDTVCSNTSITFTSTSVPGDATINQYNWSFNDGSPPVTGVQSVTHQFIFSGSTPQAFYPNLTINDANNCNSAISDTVYVFPLPVASFTANPNGSCTTPAVINFINNSQNTNTYSWNFGDTASGAANTSTLSNPSHTYTATGSYTVTLTAGVPGCSASQASVITIASPVASFSASDTVICPWDTVDFTNSGTSGTYLWNFADPLSGSNNTSSLQDPSHMFSTPGNYAVSLTVIIGGCTNTFIRNITVRQPASPVINVPVRSACEVPFTATFTETGSGISGWQWDFGDPSSGAQNTSNMQNPSHTYNSFGIYTISLITTDNSGCSDTTVLPSHINITPPTIDFTETDSGCVGSTFNFNATVSSPADPVIVDYTWRFGDGTGPHSSGNNPGISHTFNNVGIFDVTLIVTTQSGCTATLVKPAYIKIGTPPVANFTAEPLDTCFDSNVQFTDLTPSPVTGWLWSFGDGGGATTQHPNYQYNVDTSGTADPFDVQLIAFYNGCPDTFEIQDMITIRGPIPNFSFLTNCSNPYSVAFTNLSGGATSYVWDFGDATPTSTQTDPTHVYANRGTYTVTLTATSTASGCTIDTVYTVRVTDPVAALVTDTTIACRPGIINFTGNTSIDVASQVWYFGEGIPNVQDTSNLLDDSHIYNSTGFFDVQFIVTDIYGCTDTATTQIHILGPTAGFVASPFTGCAPITVTFTDTSYTEGGAISQWFWNYGSTTRTITSPPGTDTLTYSTPGNYTVSLTVTDVNGCSNTATSTNYIRPTRPVPVIAQPDTSCRNTQLTFNATPGPFVAQPVSYQWDFGDGNTTTTTTGTVNHSYANNGSYPVTLVVTDDNGCVGSTTSNIFVYTTPASFQYTLNDTCVDQGGIKKAQIISVFTSDSNAYASNYSWDLTAVSLTDPSLSSAFYTFDLPGTYSVEFVITNRFGCSDTAFSPDLVVLNAPTGTFSFLPDSGCRPLTVNFLGSSTNVNFYAWDFGDGTVIPNTLDTAVTHTYTTTGDFVPQFYLAYLFDTLNNEVCMIRVPTYDTVKVTSLVSVDILEDSIYVTDGERDTLHVFTSNPSGQPLTYEWRPSGFVTQDPVLSNTFYATTNGSDSYYYVEVFYGTTGCSGTDSVLVLYKPCETLLDIPNVFTPNNDSKNDTYYIEDLCNFEDFRFVIYNRWGKLIYESTDVKFRWDGKTSGGTEVSEGVYYYVLHAKSKDYNGYIQLIRE